MLRTNLDNAHVNWHTPQALGNGRYELREFIGKGGMGVVYKAHDVELDRAVAVKCLLDVTRQGSRELAVKEAKTLASLAHPNIMRVFDILSTQNQVWIVSEWLEGKLLSQLPLPLPAAAVLAIMTQVYDALAAAHAAQIFHRDIKPANIINGNDGRITLIDFGVAYAPGLSTGATLAGSLRFTDPRILEGEAPDALSDLFSAALLQIELMTGEAVLPELAPLPLHRYIKRHLEGRLDELLEGQYPPLVELARRFGGKARLKNSADLRAAREAAFAARDALRELTPKRPECYLEAGLCLGNIADLVPRQVFAKMARNALQNPALSPKQKAAWIAFQAAREEAGTETERGFRLLGRPRERTPTRVKAKFRRKRRKWILGWTGVFIATTSLLVGLLLGKIGEHRFDGPSSNPARDNLTRNPDLTGPLQAESGAALSWQGIYSSPSGAKAVLAHLSPFLAPVRPLEPEKAPRSSIHPDSEDAAKNAAQRASRDRVPFFLVANAWATVKIDGLEVGRLPQAAPFMLTPGPHRLQLSSPIVETLTTEIHVKKATPGHLKFALVARTSSRVVSLSTPGRLFVDGLDHGVVKQVTIPLSYGPHRIWVERGKTVGTPLDLALGPSSPREIKIE